ASPARHAARAKTTAALRATQPPAGGRARRGHSVPSGQSVTSYRLTAPRSSTLPDLTWMRAAELFNLAVFAWARQASRTGRFMASEANERGPDRNFFGRSGIPVSRPMTDCGPQFRRVQPAREEADDDLPLVSR